MWPAAPGSGWGAGMGGSELGTHALQSVRVVHCSGCPYLRLAASPYIQQPGRGEPYMYPEPGVKCALEWRSPVYRGCGGGLMGKRNAWLYLPALKPSAGSLRHLAVGSRSNLATCGPPGAPWASLRVYTCLTSISELKCM